ncbi:MAG: hypothetical protein AAB864_00970 [Patescibacteria group bacterium]
MRYATTQGRIIWPFRPDCSTTPGTYTAWVIDDATGRRTNDIQETVLSSSACSGITPSPVSSRPTPEQYGLKEGNTVSAANSADPDIYIINQHGFKRLFLNPVIFGFYGHLGGFSKVRTISSTTRDVFETTVFFRNCETGDQRVYALEVTGEDTGTLHWLNVDGGTIASQDPEFFKKVFCINTNEYGWYAKSITPYTSLSQVPAYRR